MPAPQLPDEVMTWAFGNQWQIVEIRELPDMWNETHSNLFIVRNDDSIEETNIKILEAYRNQELAVTE